MPPTNRLAVALDSAARGDFPKADGAVEVLSPPPGRAMAVVAFTAHCMIASSVPEDWIHSQLLPDDLLAPMSPRFLAALGDKLSRHDDGINLVLAARGLQGRTTLRETTSEGPRQLTSATAHRDEVRVFADPTGAATIILGRGLANRTEVASRSTRIAETRGSHDKHSPRHAASSGAEGIPLRPNRPRQRGLDPHVAHSWLSTDR